VYAWFPDGAIRRLSPEPGFFVQACVNPQGKGAVFWGGAEGRPRLWLADFASNRVRPLTSPDIGSVEPSFDGEGRRIVFASDAAAPAHLELTAIAQSWRNRTFGYETSLNLFVVNADGTKRRQITRGPFQDSRPAFDPEGKNVVFLSNRGGDRNGLYIAPADGSAPPRRLLKEGGIGRPWFSTDGKFIYFFFTSVPDEHRRISRLPLDGRPWEPVTPDDFPRSHGPFADPDGVHLWFHSTKGGTVSPYRFNLRTGELVRLLPPGFTAAAHVTRSRNGVVTFDSRQLVDRKGGFVPPNKQMQRTSAAQAMDARR
jgi:dipeptidyl aminopeptidase/acylaminoacyl peptidase